MNAPSQKRSAPGFGEESQALQNFVLAENKAAWAQLQPLLAHWYREAERIAREFNRTRHAKHLRAFCHQMIGILAAVERGLPR